MTSPPEIPAPDADIDPQRLHAPYGHSFNVGEVIFREGETGAEAYLLEEGRVRLLKKVRGAERSLMILNPGDLFGELALIAGAVGSPTAIALPTGLGLAPAQTTHPALPQN